MTHATDSHDDEFSQGAQNILTKIGTQNEVDELSVTAISAILDRYVVHHGLGDTLAGYFRAAEMLRDTMFPNSPLAGSRAELDAFSNERADTRNRVRAIGLLLARALGAGDPVIRKGAELFFKFLEQGGYFPDDCIE